MIRSARLAAIAVSVLALASSAHSAKPPAPSAKAPATAPAAKAPARAAPVAGAVVDRRPKGVWPQTYSDIAPDPTVKLGTLPN